MTNKNNLPDSILDHIPWDSKGDPIWPASLFTLHRNIEEYPFPSKLEEKQSKDLLKTLEKSFSKLPELKKTYYLPAESLSSQEKEFLCEHFLSQNGWQNSSKGQAFVIDESSHFLATLNFDNHLTLQWVDCKGQWDKAWSALNSIETSIGKELEYAFSPEFGYLSNHSNLCGTGLLIACYLHLPALILSEKLPGLLIDILGENIRDSGFFGSKDFIGGFLVLRNAHTLGVTEESTLKDLHKAATELVLAEKDERISYKKNPSIELKDRISRAFGLFIHSCQLDTKEALDALSQLKLGIDLGWVKGISDEEVNELLFRCRRAHLLQSHKKIALNKKELSEARAEYLHEKLQKATLKF